MNDKQITIRYDSDVADGLVHVPEYGPDTLTWWAEQYFKHEVSTAAATKKAQRRNLNHFILFMMREEGTDERPRWTPRLSRAFLEHLQTITDETKGLSTARINRK